MAKPIKDRVMGVLLQRSDQWTLARHIAREADCHSGPSEPTVRAAIAALIEEGVPIVSCQSGYKIAMSDAEVDYAARELNIRAQEIQRRTANLRRAWRLWKAAGDL